MRDAPQTERVTREQAAVRVSAAVRGVSHTLLERF